MAKMNVLGTEISVIRINDDDYISLTDMVHNIENGEFFIHNWLRNRNTVEFLGIWEKVYNLNFNPEKNNVLQIIKHFYIHNNVIFTGFFTIKAHNKPEMRPTQFATQCVANLITWPCKIELSKIP